MEIHGCINGTLEGTDRYSAPVPLIGIYIAAASMVCSLLMLYDIVHGIVKRQRWLPCKLFKLNSVTLSLIGVVVKLTVDLTTPMPSALDQLSKLAGTTSLCIYMCYISPSIGDMKDSTNMYAVSILVITVFVNMCIQLSTGVISLFIPEHITVLSLMLVLLLILWHFVLTSKVTNKTHVSFRKYILINGLSVDGKENFLQRLKDCYLDSYKSNPQFVTSRGMDCGIVGDLSLVCLAILTQAAVRSVILKKEVFCKGNSDHLWSMATIVATQLVAVTTGAFSSYFRRCTMTSRLDNDIQRNLIEHRSLSNPIWKDKFFFVDATNKVYIKVIVKISWLVNAANNVYIKIIVLSYWLSSAPTLAFSWLKSKMRCTSANSHMSSGGEWTLRKSVTHFEKLMEKSKEESSDLCNLLSRILPPLQSVNPPRYQGPRPRDVTVHYPLRIRERLLPLVVLVKIVEVVIPESLESRNIVLSTFNETFETLHFIEKHMHNTDPLATWLTEVAKAVWAAGDFGRLLPKTSRDYDDLASPLDRALHMIDHFYSMMPHDPIYEQVECIRHLVTRRTYSSLEELWHFMEDLFVSLLDPMLALLPEAIFKAVTESPADEYNERVKQSLEYLCKFDSWKGVLRWEVPRGCLLCSSFVNLELQAALPDELEGQHKLLGNTSIEFPETSTQNELQSTSLAAKSAPEFMLDDQVIERYRVRKFKLIVQ